jgi:hypothetical protein
MSKTEKKTRVIVVRDDIDRHEAGCNCGECNSQGKSYGASVYPLPDGVPSEDVDFHNIENIARFYAPSEGAAESRAKTWARDNNYRVVL